MIELNSLTTPSPYKEISIRSAIADVLIDNERGELVAQFNLDAFMLNILAVERTLIEKVLAILNTATIKMIPSLCCKTKIVTYIIFTKLCSVPR